MPFTADLEVTQGSDCSTITVMDTSDYSGETQESFVSRVLSIYKSDGTKFSGDDIDFGFTAFADDDIDIADIDRDYCFRIVLTCTPVSAQTDSTYTKEVIVSLVCNTEKKLYSVGQAVALSPSKKDDKDFRENWRLLSLFKDVAVRSATYGDQVAADQALKEAKKIIDSSTLNF